MAPDRSRSRFWAYLRPYRGTLALSTFIGVLKYNLPVDSLTLADKLRALRDRVRRFIPLSRRSIEMRPGCPRWRRSSSLRCGGWSRRREAASGSR